MAQSSATTKGLPKHGGALVAAAEAYGIPLADWLDLSTGINPLAYPLPAMPAEDYRRLPDPASLTALTDLARGVYGVGSGTDVLAVPGTDLAIRLLPLLYPQGPVAILSPTYSGHTEAWAAAGHEVRRCPDLAAAHDAAMVVLANPNNPDGRLLAPDALLAAMKGEPRRAFVVDEAFCDLVPEASLVPHLAGRAVVLRSFGKFYGLAGLRLGFVLGNAAIVGRLRTLLGDWPVSGPAIRAGLTALADREWAGAARRRLAADRARLDGLLRRHGLTAIEGADLFLSVLTPAAQRLHAALARRGIWTRIFADDPTRIRIGLPPAESFDRLEAALAETVPEALAEA